MVLSISKVLSLLAMSVAVAQAAMTSYFVEFDSALFSAGAGAEPPTVTNFYNWMAGANNTLAPITNLPLNFLIQQRLLTVVNGSVVKMTAAGVVAAALQPGVVSVDAAFSLVVPEPAPSTPPFKFDNVSLPGDLEEAYKRLLPNFSGSRRMLKGHSGLYTARRASAKAKEHAPQESIAQHRNLQDNGNNDDPPPVREQENLLIRGLYGLDQMDDLANLDDSYEFVRAGANVDVYVVDSGIRATHEQFDQGRVKAGRNYVEDGRGTNDCNGHGTHVAGTIGGRDTGIAKAVRLYPIRIFGCSGTSQSTSLLMALDYVNRMATQRRTTEGRFAVVNLSLGGPQDATLNAAVNTLVANGHVVVSAAGNDNQNACNYSPASAQGSITVAAHDISTDKTDFSNFGSCVDLYAPGARILSAWFTGDDDTQFLSGTSMSAPHVSGLIARYLEQSEDPSTARTALLCSAENGAVDGNPANTPNERAYANPAGLSRVSATGQCRGPPPASAATRRASWALLILVGFMTVYSSYVVREESMAQQQ